MLKNIIKHIYYKIKYKNNIHLGRKCLIGGFHTEFEGMNSIGDFSVFEGAIGFGSYIGRNSFFEGKIGKYCSIGSNVRTVVGNHPVDTFVSTHPAFFSTEKQAGFTYVDLTMFNERSYAGENYYIVVENDVWIGDDAKILNGIKIGNGAVIAAGALVTKDVEPYTIVGGVPAKTIKKRFSDDIIEYLLEFKWWEKDSGWVQNNALLFSNVEKFVESTNSESGKNQ